MHPFLCGKIKIEMHDFTCLVLVFTLQLMLPCLVAMVFFLGTCCDGYYFIFVRIIAIGHILMCIHACFCDLFIWQ
jgi:hypothetical protein